jgi:DNA invertase Pin-like site-specific DNA recombinase
MPSQLSLSGTGAAYVRVSDKGQDPARQRTSIHAFEERHGVKITPQHWYEDHGLKRHESDKRPAFQRMLAAVRAGRLGWVVVDQIDRFGFKDQYEAGELVAPLRRAGCRLYDTKDEDWSGDDFISFMKLGFAGHASRTEQVTKSLRALGGMVEGAKRGEYQGGPPKFGFDIDCLDRATGAEQWRVVYEGRDLVGIEEDEDGKRHRVYHMRRRKVYPDGHEERFDGKVVFRTSEDTQLIRQVPAKDPARREAVQKLFRRYATETISFAGLAKWLNGLKITNAYHQPFQSRDVLLILGDDSYTGHPTFGRRRKGGFHRIDGGVVKELERDSKLKGKETIAAPADVIKSATPLYEPFVDQDLWDRVQRKLHGRSRASYAPRKPEMFRRCSCRGWCTVPTAASP